MLYANIILITSLEELSPFLLEMCSEKSRRCGICSARLWETLIIAERTLRSLLPEEIINGWCLLQQKYFSICLANYLQVRSYFFFLFLTFCRIFLGKKKKKWRKVWIVMNQVKGYTFINDTFSMREMQQQTCCIIHMYPHHTRKKLSKSLLNREKRLTNLNDPIFSQVPM